MKPFLRWPGGKRWLAPRLSQIIGTIENRYIEPFLGSGALLFALEPKTATLSDINCNLIDMYREIAQNPSEVLKLLKHHHKNHSEDYYYQIRSKKFRSSSKKAAQLIYLNRTCFNGIYRVNKDGFFNVPVGTQRDVLRPDDDFEGVSTLLSNFEIISQDFEISIDTAQKGDVIFADPPYTVNHNNNGFLTYNENLFTWADQERLAQALDRARNRGARIFLSNADHGSIHDLYSSRWHITTYCRSSVIAGLSENRGVTAELLITSEPIEEAQHSLPLNNPILETGM